MMYDVWGSGDSLFTVGPIFIGIIFVIVFIGIIVSLSNGLRQWKINEDSPRLSVPAIVKSKRTNVSRHSHHHDHHHSHSHGSRRLILLHLNSRVAIVQNFMFQARSTVCLQKEISAP